MFVAPKIRWRTAFTYAIIILLLMLLLSFLLATQFERWYAQQLRDQWSTYAGKLVDDVMFRTALQNYQAAGEANTNLVNTNDVEPTWSAVNRELSTKLKGQTTPFTLRLSTFTTDGTLIADSHFDGDSADGIPVINQLELQPSPPSLTPVFDTYLRQTALSILTPILDNGESIGLLRLRVPFVQSSYRNLLLRSFILPMTMSIGLVIIGMLVVQTERTANTLRRLTAVAEQITQGDLSARTLSLSGGEIGQLSRTFNRMADKLQQQITKRAREKDRLRTMLHIMSDGVLLLNRHGSVRVLNEAAADILKTQVKRAFKRSFVQTVRDHRFVEVLRRCQASGQTETATLELDSGVVIRMIVTPFLRGRDRGHLVVLQDLTRLYQLQTTRQDFVSNISHELRTPLASLRALAETLIDGAIDDREAAVRFLHHMEVEVDALTQMVQELFQLSLVESGKANLELSAVPASTLIRKGAERLQAQAERAGISLVVDIPPELPNVNADAGRVEQVLTNLIHNAIKFTPSEGTIRVTAEYRPDDEPSEMVTVRVADSGVGIAHDDLPRIFERFYKADRARTGGGTGLGLAIAKHLVQAHGGTIWAESSPSKGSCFSFTLPVVNDPITGDPIITAQHSTVLDPLTD